MNNKFTIKHYQNKRLKPYDKLKTKVHPIYIRIQYQRDTYNVRSPLMDRIVNDNFVNYGYVINDQDLGPGSSSYHEIGFEIDDQIFIDKGFNELCQYEADAIIRIKDRFFNDTNFNVPDLIKLYGYYGTDAFELISSKILNEIGESRAFTPNFKDSIKHLSNTFTSKRVVLMLEEAGFTKLVPASDIDGKLWGLKYDLTALASAMIESIAHTHLYFMLLMSSEEDVAKADLDPLKVAKTKDIGLLIYYFPVVYFHDKANVLADGNSLKERILGLAKYLPEPKEREAINSKD